MAKKKVNFLVLQNLVLLLFFTVFMPSRAVFPGTENNWKTSKSTHFIIYYKNAPDTFIEEVIRKSEDLYNNIADSLGFTRFDFWLWDNRAKIYIYDSVKDYQTGTGQPVWSSGASMPKEKIIHTFVFEKGFFDMILPHELGHIIFREFVGFDNSAIPLWLDEGVASYQEKSRYSFSDDVVRRAIKDNSFFSLQKLFTIRPQSVSDSLYVRIFYAEAVSVVGYLIKVFGKDRFVLFCQNLRDKRNFEKAMRSVYPFMTIDEFDKAWQKYLNNK
ncbi:MAG: peptidase MA family metallohydrolase [Candidatus Omnitrophota bacterium]